MRKEIISTLESLEISHNIKILYACESGSRAWGFPSADSDYDIRFFYIHPQSWYLSIDDKKDTISDVGKILDFHGWELRKMLQLFRGSNISLFEKLQSPIIYKSDEKLRGTLWSISDEYFSARSGLHHYLSLAHNFYKEELTKQDVKLKKYFYALRSVMAARWIRINDEAPPMEFEILKKLEKSKDWQSLIDSLLFTKSKADESFTISQRVELNDFIMAEILEGEKYAKTIRTKPKPDSAYLNQLFRSFIIA